MTAGLEPRPIRVPGLWEAQGLLELDGVAWYRRRFSLDDPGGHWTLRFGAVMDLAEVYLNGRPLGGNDLPFTPFELDPSAALAAGPNELAVRVTEGEPAPVPGDAVQLQQALGLPQPGDPDRPRLQPTERGQLVVAGVQLPGAVQGPGPVAGRFQGRDGRVDDLAHMHLACVRGSGGSEGTSRGRPGTPWPPVDGRGGRRRCRTPARAG